ncbi:MAG: hypothetical protein Nk1A_3260 [Endomicrobiia bacterium]|nr:MAG: hypothetical protein Nk1A_3260 [Endomicrobiia bacterium]
MSKKTIEEIENRIENNVKEFSKFELSNLSKSMLNKGFERISKKRNVKLKPYKVILGLIGA